MESDDLSGHSLCYFTFSLKVIISSFPLVIEETEPNLVHWCGFVIIAIIYPVLTGHRNKSGQSFAAA